MSARIAAAWLNDLAVVVAGVTPVADLKAKVAAMAGLLAEDYPPEAFTRASLNHVARQCRFFPSYGELTEHLSAWWQAHRPPPRALPAPGSGQIDRVEEARLFWNTMTDAELRARVAKIDAIHDGFQAVLRLSCVNGLRNHAPHRLGMLPPSWFGPDQPPPGGSAEPVPIRPKALHLPPEQLAELRKPRAA